MRAVPHGGGLALRRARAGLVLEQHHRSASIPARISMRRSTGSPARILPNNAVDTIAGGEFHRAGRGDRYARRNRAANAGLRADRAVRRGVGSAARAHRSRAAGCCCAPIGRRGAGRDYAGMREDGAHTPGPCPEVVKWLVEERDVHGFGTETIGTDAGQAIHFNPPYPAHYLHARQGPLRPAVPDQSRPAAADRRGDHRRAAEDHARDRAARCACWRWCRAGSGERERAQTRDRHRRSGRHRCRDLPRRCSSAAIEVVSLALDKPDWSHPRLDVRTVDLFDAKATTELAAEIAGRARRHARRPQCRRHPAQCGRSRDGRGHRGAAQLHLGAPLILLAGVAAGDEAAALRPHRADVVARRAGRRQPDGLFGDQGRHHRHGADLGAGAGALGITVNMVAPGPIQDTEMFHEIVPPAASARRRSPRPFRCAGWASPMMSPVP